MLHPNLDVDVLTPPATPNSLTTARDTTINLPLGFDLDDFTAELTGGITEAMVAPITVLANNNVFQKYFSMADLDLLNKFLGIPAYNAVAGHDYVHIRFNRSAQFGGREIYTPSQGNAAAVLVSGAIRNLQSETRFRTGNYGPDGIGVGNPQVKLSMNNTPATGALQVTPFTRGTPTVQGSGPGLCRTVQAVQINAASGQVVTLNQQNGLVLGTGQTQNVDRIFLVDPNSSISAIQVKIGNTTLRNRDNNLAAFYRLLTPTYRADQATAYVVDFTDRLYGDEDPQDGLSQLQISFTVGTGGPISFYVDGSGNPLASPSVVLAGK